MHSCSSALIVTPKTALLPAAGPEVSMTAHTVIMNMLLKHHPLVEMGLHRHAELCAWWTALSSGLTGRPGWHGINRGCHFTHSLHNLLHSQGLCLTHGTWLSIIQQVCCHISDASCHTGMVRAVESQFTCTSQPCVHGTCLSSQEP